MNISFKPEITGEGSVWFEHPQISGGGMACSTKWAKVYFKQLARAICQAEGKATTFHNIMDCIEF